MRLPVCVFDVESDMLCPSCQEKLDKGEITQFDVDFCKWLLERQKQFPAIGDLSLLRALRVADRLVLIVKKKGRDLLLSEKELMDEMGKAFGRVLIIEGPLSLRSVVKELIHPAVELGVNSLFLPDRTRENIVVLRSEDKSRIPYSLEELRLIASAAVGESVLFQYQEETKKTEEKPSDVFEERMKSFTQKQPKR
ncbi:MAG: hypothetical protein C4K49_03045 [Candidatus Thorarchaeota archaeon]|nr:MAG: hypothetical protein C4K49_03045 [Candidatus Thorarchaeota archaeon]